MGKMKQLQKEADEANTPKMFATNDSFQVLVLETIHNQKSMGWMAQEDNPKRFVIFDHNAEVNKHLELWNQIQSAKLSDLDTLSTYLFNTLDEASRHNFDLAFTNQEGAENE